MTFALHHVVFPDASDAEIHPLYLRADGGARIMGRRSVAIEGGASVSFGTYFNAFPAAYWAHWTTVVRVELRVRVEGRATVRVMRSDASGGSRLATQALVEDAIEGFPVAIEGFDQGGWLWFDVESAGGPVVVTEASWISSAAPIRVPRAAIGITTFNKPDYALATLGAVAGAAELRDHLSKVVVVDQGDRQVSAEPGFPDVRELLGDALSIVRQPNLGGSGGYARAMAETLRGTDAEYVMLIDDDVEVEPEAIRRAVIFASYCPTPTIVGGHMIDLLARTKLYAWAEVVDRRPFMWHARYEDRMPVDLATSDLRRTPLLHQRMDADYNGWWMCLIPREVIRAVGLPLPAFIKWDDAEFSLRSGREGIPTVSLPGAALWHVSWVGKDDQIDWQAYFHARNRIVSALLHSEEPRGGSLLTHSRRVDTKHLLAMQYYPVALRHRALEAVLSGPEHLHHDLARALPSARALASDFGETAPASQVTSAVTPEWREDGDDMPRGMRLRVFMAWTLLRLWFHRTRVGARAVPEVGVRARQAKWWRLARYDSASVRMAGSGVQHLYVRDRDQYRRRTRDSVRLHRELRRRWDDLAAQYRGADLTSLERWEETFREAGAPLAESDSPSSEQPLG